tara:strand:- start:244 stop:1662 length:1419 start_codon:yes stop_codon:yes gene_type:complete
MNNTNIKSLANKFYNFEIKHDLFSLRIKNKVYWDYVRLYIFEEIVHSHFGKRPYKDGKKRILHLAINLLKYFFARMFSFVFSNKNYDIILINYNRNNIVDNKHVNIHMYFTAKCIDPEKTLLIDPSGDTQNKDDYLCKILNAKSTYIYARFLSKLIMFNRAERNKLINLKGLIKRNFDVDINIQSVAKNIFGYQVLLGKQYRRLFKLYNPSIIIYCDNGYMKGIADEASKNNIIKIDHQHSLISYLNVLYNYKSSSINCITSTIPDYIFTFGDYWLDKINTMSKPITVGFPYFDHKYKKLIASKSIEKSKSIIIISMLTGNSKSILIDYAIALSMRLPDWTIYYKLRNYEFKSWKETYPKEILRENIIMVDSNVPELYDIFSKCSYQIGINSTAIYEGIAFGLSTILIKTGWYQEAEPLYLNNKAFLVDNYEEAYQIIIKNKTIDEPVDKNSIFAENSIHNTVNALKNINLQ